MFIVGGKVWSFREGLRAILDMLTSHWPLPAATEHLKSFLKFVLSSRVLLIGGKSDTGPDGGSHCLTDCECLGREGPSPSQRSKIFPSSEIPRCRYWVDSNRTHVKPFSDTRNKEVAGNCFSFCIRMLGLP